MRRLEVLVGVLAALFIAGPGCNRIGDLEDEEIETDLLYFCAPVNGAFGRWEDGEQHVILGPDGGHSQVCRCMTEEEYWDEVYHDWFHEEAYKTCLDDAERMGFVWNDCDVAYENGVWRSEVWWEESSEGREGELCLGIEPDETDDAGCNVE